MVQYLHFSILEIPLTMVVPWFMMMYRKINNTKSTKSGAEQPRNIHGFRSKRALLSEREMEMPETIRVCLKMVAKPLNPMVLLIIIPMKNGYFIGKINPTFSDKPIKRLRFRTVLLLSLGYLHCLYGSSASSFSLAGSCPTLPHACRQLNDSQKFRYTGNKSKTSRVLYHACLCSNNYVHHN